MSRVTDNCCSYILSVFSVVSSKMINPVSVIPSWPKAKSETYIALMFFLDFSTKTIIIILSSSVKMGILVWLLFIEKSFSFTTECDVRSKFFEDAFCQVEKCFFYS